MRLVGYAFAFFLVAYWLPISQCINYEGEGFKLTAFDLEADALPMRRAPVFLDVRM